MYRLSLTRVGPVVHYDTDVFRWGVDCEIRRRVSWKRRELARN